MATNSFWIGNHFEEFRSQVAIRKKKNFTPWYNYLKRTSFDLTHKSRHCTAYQILTFRVLVHTRKVKIWFILRSFITSMVTANLKVKTGYFSFQNFLQTYMLYIFSSGWTSLKKFSRNTSHKYKPVLICIKHGRNFIQIVQDQCSKLRMIFGSH